MVELTFGGGRSSWSERSLANSATASLNLGQTFLIKCAAFSVGLCELQALQGDFIVVGSQRALFQKFFGFFGGLGRIAGKHALVKDFRGRKRRPIPEHDIKEFQALDMASKHDQTYRQGRGQHQPYGPPKCRPERRRRDDGNRRKPGAVAVDHRLDDMSYERFHNKKKCRVHNSMDQPGSTATARASGKAAAITAPMYGTKRSTAARMPHRIGLGIPMSHKPMPITTPKAPFTRAGSGTAG